MARRATLIDSLRNEASNLLVLDAGNWGDTNPSFGRLKSDFIFKTMQRLGIDAVGLGDREFTGGVDRVLELAGDSPAVLASNIQRNGQPFQNEPYVRTIDGVKVGVFHLVQDVILDRAGAEVADEFSASDVFDASDRLVADLKDRGCDLIVMSSQLELAFADSVIRRHTDDIDVAVLGYRGAVRKKHDQVENTIVIRPGSRGQHVGFVEVEVDPAGEVVSFDGEAITLDNKIEKDAPTLVLVNEVEAETDRLRKEARALRQVEFQNQQRVDRFLGAETCARCHQAEFETWQNGPHAHAWTTLVDLGMEGNDECVSCHVTGHDEATGFKSPMMSPDLSSVQCEACHDMGTLHEPVGGADQVAANCVACHDEENSPEFDLTSYLEKIRHW